MFEVFCSIILNSTSVKSKNESSTLSISDNFDVPATDISWFRSEHKQDILLLDIIQLEVEMA